MDNNPNGQSILAILKTMVGQEVSQSPSPFMNWLKPTVISAEHGRLRCSYLVRYDMSNPYGILHGGVTAALIDDLIGATVVAMGLANRYTTINNTIDYFSSAKVGSTIVAETRVVKQGKSIINLECEVFFEENRKLLAKGQSNMLRLDA